MIFPTFFANRLDDTVQPTQLLRARLVGIRLEIGEVPWWEHIFPAMPVKNDSKDMVDPKIEGGDRNQNLAYQRK